MDIEFHRRAEIALRSLTADDKRRVDSVLVRLRRARPFDVLQSIGAQRLKTDGGDDLFSVRAGHEIRIVVSMSSDTLLVQDIVPYERLGNVLAQAS